MDTLQITAKEHIELIIENGSEGWFDHIDALVQYPIDAVLPHFEGVDKKFIRSAGWALLSENDKVIKLAEWLKRQMERNVPITFTYGQSIEYTLKYWAIGAIEHICCSE